MREKLRMLINAFVFYIKAKTYRIIDDQQLSGFVYEILEVRSLNPLLEKIEQHRKKLLKNKNLIEFSQYGAGGIFSGSKRVNELVRPSLSPRWKCQVLYSLASKLKHGSILELGTSFGISASYLAVAYPGGNIFTIEGSISIQEYARNFFDESGLQNIKSIYGDFDSVLEDVLEKIPEIGMAYIDGNHRKKATVDYFEKIVRKCHPGSFIVIDDIYWSAEMKEAWSEIKGNPKVSSTIDLFQMGIVMFDPGLKGHHRLIKRRYKPFG